ncbi:MAG: hypothetical protein QF921_17615 [Pseudomonadales bacterium]|jgi:hypothetical protein|nr:hypothetical protein [Pseudomonadales bacterium]MDP6472869.1 hypothetical protein [Pseudomonadales bacterium]MDP6826375.1 hypothetical protein [Pseudomonadales bacterium]MDP6973305.1 hypothetical protein [Pseudomonadales bacterium]
MSCVRILTVATAALALAGCVSGTIEEVREAATSMGSDDYLVVLGKRPRPMNSETELNFISCVSENVGGGSDALNVIDEQAFMDAMFPWFEPRTAPVKTDDLPELMGQPLLSERLEEIGLKYLVWVEGSTERTDSEGSLTCSVAATGAGCFGFLTWENDSSYETTIWDVRTSRVVGRISSDAIGTSYMPAVVLPIPLIARVKSSACSSLAAQLKSFIQSDA